MLTSVISLGPPRKSHSQKAEPACYHLLTPLGIDLRFSASAMFSKTTRISRGFHRIGATLAVPLLLLALWLAYGAWKEARPSSNAYIIEEGNKKYDVRAPDKAAALYAYAKMKGRTPLDPDNIFADVPPVGVNIVAFDPKPTPDFTSASLTAAAGVALYLVSRTLGWIINGFTR